MCRLTIDGSGVTWKLVTIARRPRPDTATSCSICNFIIWFHDRAASWCQSIITRDSHPDKFAVCPTAQLHLSIQYLHNIYTVIHNIYTASTTVSSHPARWPWPACCLSWWWRAGGRAAPAPATTSPHPASPQLLTVVTSPPSSLGLSKPGSSCTPEPRDDCTDKRPDCRL